MKCVPSARLEEQNGHLTQVEVNEMLGLVSDVAAKVPPDDAVPGRIVLLVKLLCGKYRVSFSKKINKSRTMVHNFIWTSNSGHNIHVTLPRKLQTEGGSAAVKSYGTRDSLFFIILPTLIGLLQNKTLELHGKCSC